MRQRREYRSSGLLRSLTLLRTFLIASAVILAVGAVALSSTLSGDLRDAALEDSARDVAAYTDAVLAPSLVRGNGVVVTRRTALARSPPADVRGSQRLRAGRPTRVLDDPPGAGRAPPLEPGSAGAIETRRAHGRDRRSDRQGASGRQGLGAAPTSARSRVGAAEVVARRLRRHADDRRLAGDDLVRRRDRVRRALARPRAPRPRCVRAAPRAERRPRGALARPRSSRRASSRRRCSRRSRRSTRQSRLATRTRPVTRSACAASRSRSAASSAFPRSSSARSRRPRSSTTSARSGCPTRSSRSPRTLDRAEAAIMREHVTAARRSSRGSRRCKDSVPAIRHHHERWDGLGYPDRLSGNGHPGRGRDHRDRRRVGRDDDRSPVRGRARHGRGDAPDPGRPRQAVQPGGRRRVPRRSRAVGRRRSCRRSDARSAVAAPSERSRRKGEIGVDHLALELLRGGIPGEEDRVPPLEPLARRLVVEPARLVRRR